MNKNIDKEVEDSFQAYLTENAAFTQNEEYPILKEWMVPTDPPLRIIPFEKAICSSKDLSNTFICFYSRDASFERIRRNPKRYIHFFKRCGGIIGFDYSIHSDMPYIKQKSQINDNLSLTYYYGEKGIPIIPNIRWGADQTADEFLAAIPKQSLVAIGTHGFSRRLEETAEWYCSLEKLIEVAKPTGIVVYGSKDERLFSHFKGKTRLFFYAPWINEDRERRKINNGN